MKQLNMIDDLGWLLETYAPEEVTVHSNSKVNHEKFDKWFLEQCGYDENATVKYSIKKGKTTLLGNPRMHEGLE